MRVKNTHDYAPKFGVEDSMRIWIVKPVDRAAARRAALYVCGKSESASEAAMMLNMLGLVARLTGAE